MMVRAPDPTDIGRWDGRESGVAVTVTEARLRHQQG